MEDRPNTPGAGGYVLAVVVSVLTITTVYVGCVGLALASSGEATVEVLGAVVAVWLWFTVIGLLVATPLALVGVPLVHLLARHHSSQRAHVLVTGLVSFAVVVVVLVLADPRQLGEPLVPMAVATPVALATMVGRAAVVPLVRRRRATRPELRRTP